MSSKAQGKYIQFTGESLGSIRFHPGQFGQEVFRELDESKLRDDSVFTKHQKVSRILFDAIQGYDEGCFLLPQVVDYISHVKKFIPTYHFSSFEFWLNHYCKESDLVKMRVRGKIVGKYIPRDRYQNLLPVGNKPVFGPHFSLAHFSPDIDTTIASFSHFLNAFSSRIGSSRHFWVLPGGPPEGAIELDFVFKEAFGQEVFMNLALLEKTISVSSLDLLTQEGLTFKGLRDLSYDVDGSEGKKAVLLTDDQGCYIGDWHEIDVDSVRGIIRRFQEMLTEYQNQLVIQSVSLFARGPATQKDVSLFIESMLTRRLNESNILRGITARHRANLDLFLRDVIGVPAGYGLTMNDFIDAIDPNFGYHKFREELKAFANKELSPEKIFISLESIFLAESAAHNQFIHYMDTLDVALKIKQNVLGLEKKYLSHLSEYEQIVQEMKAFPYLTVNYSEGDKLYPLGVVHREDALKKIVASSSWIDFSNPGETDVHPEIDVISILDHHKSQIKTAKASTMHILDAQSSNSIMAKIAFEHNDLYSNGGMTIQEIEREMDELQNTLDNPSHIRRFERLLQRKKAILSRGEYFVSYEREVLEYLQFIFAILDDTDLLTKVSAFDLDCLASLVNRLKSLQVGKEVEVVHFDDITRSAPTFLQQAAKRLIQTKELYSLYSVIYQMKEDALSLVIQNAVKEEETPFFQDTKTLASGHAVITQFKHFANNEKTLRKYKNELYKKWVARCEKMHAEMTNGIFFMLMLSTLPSAEELFSGDVLQKSYKDELWFYVPEGNKKALHFLKSFLKEFQASPVIKEQDLEIVFMGNAIKYEDDLLEVLQRGFSKEIIRSMPSMLVMKVEQGSVKSRKTDVAPYL